MKNRVLFSLLSIVILSSQFLVYADEVRLKVVDGDGKPVAGAAIKVLEATGFAQWRKVAALRDFNSDENGTIAFDSILSLQRKPTDTLQTEPEAIARVIAKDFAIYGISLQPGDNTITLPKPTTIDGVVFDEDQKPVAGAKVSLNGINPIASDEKNVYFVDDLRIETQTDAEGKWRFDNVPISGVATVSAGDDRFVIESVAFDITKNAPPIYLQLGATIKGRMLQPDGKAAANVNFYIGSGIKDQTTKADGTFEVNGLPPNTYYLQIIGSEQKLPFIVPSKNVGDLKAGETRDLGDWKTVKGDTIKGKVVDAITKKPIPLAVVRPLGRGNEQGLTNVNGSFSFMFSTGFGVSIYAPKYISWTDNGLPAGKNGVVDLGTIELNLGLKMRGVLKNEKGIALRARTIYASQRNRSRQWAQVNQDGTFQFEGLEAGEYTLEVNGLKLLSDPKFTAAPNQNKLWEFTAESTDAQNKPRELRKVSGIILDQENKPVAGAKLAIQMRSGNSYQEMKAFSGNDGAFETSTSFQEGAIKIVTVKRPGYVFTKGDFQKDNGQWQGEISMQKSGLALRGRVVDANKKGVVHAFVGLENDTELPVMTDENGEFSLPDVAPQGIVLLASSGANLTSYSVDKAGQNIEIVLPEPLKIEDRAALADQVLETARLGYEWSSRWDTLGKERIEAAILRTKTRDAGSWPWLWNFYLEKLAEHDPVDLLARKDQLLQLTPEENHADFELLVMRVRAASKDENERQTVQGWLDTKKLVKRGIDVKSVGELLNLAEIYSKLSATPNNPWLDYASQIALQLGKSAQSNAHDWGVKTAKISPLAVDIFSEEWTPIQRMIFLQGAIATYAEQGDLANAKLGFEKMAAILEETKKDPDAAVYVVEGFPQKPADLLNQAREFYVNLLARTDAKAALELIEPLEGYSRARILISIGKSAAQAGNMDLARQAWNRVFEEQSGNIELGSQAAEVALEFDPKLADELFKKSFSTSIPKPTADLGGFYPSIAAYARARAKGWAGESRILIEREWKKRVAYGKTPVNDDWDDNGQKMKSLVGSMALIDPARALEMNESVTEKQNLRAEARTDIAYELLEK